VLRDAASRLSIPYTIHAAGRESWTDADDEGAYFPCFRRGWLGLRRQKLLAPHRLFPALVSFTHGRNTGIAESHPARRWQ
jgi:hypothetical protein